MLPEYSHLPAWLQQLQQPTSRCLAPYQFFLGAFVCHLRTVQLLSLAMSQGTPPPASYYYFYYYYYYYYYCYAHFCNRNGCENSVYELRLCLNIQVRNNIFQKSTESDTTKSKETQKCCLVVIYSYLLLCFSCRRLTFLNLVYIRVHLVRLCSSNLENTPTGGRHLPDALCIKVKRCSHLSTLSW